MNLTQKHLKEVLHYDPDTGNFTWKISPAYNVKAGEIAGCIIGGDNKVLYRSVRINKRNYRAARLAFLYMNGVWPELFMDHIDGNGLNNAWDNLRDVTCKENGRNQKIASDNTSGFTGVYFDKRYGRWTASIMGNKKPIFLGSFEYKQDAINARKKANIEHGYHENHGRQNAITRI